MTSESVMRLFCDFFFCRDTTLGLSSSSGVVVLAELFCGGGGLSSIVTVFTLPDRSSGLTCKSTGNYGYEINALTIEVDTLTHRNPCRYKYKRYI